MGLSEPRRKQRIAPDPQNKTWTDNTSKPSYLMMQKMGWSAGKGMGKHEDGRTEHVKTYKKADTLGVGADKRTGDNWLENTNAFDELLKGLNAAQDLPVDDAVAEETPVMHGRLYHRTKFVRNKQVSNYDHDQLSHILGRKSLKDTESGRASPAVSEDVRTESDVDGLTRVQSVSVQDYFAAKMKEKLAKRSARGNQGSDTADQVEKVDKADAASVGKTEECKEKQSRKRKADSVPEPRRKKSKSSKEPAKPDTVSKLDKSEKPSKPVKLDKSEKQSTPVKLDKSEKPSKPVKSEKASKSKLKEKRNESS